MHFESHEFMTNDFVSQESKYMSRKIFCDYFMRHKKRVNFLRQRSPQWSSVSGTPGTEELVVEAERIEATFERAKVEICAADWLKHIQKANAALGNLTSDKMSWLQTGEAFVWSSKTTYDGFSRGAIKVKCRPRVTLDGGSTKTAVQSPGKKHGG